MALIVSSPLRRALQTSVHSFAPALQRDGVKVLLQPMAQEMNAYACDIGTAREELERQVKAGELWERRLGVSREKVDFSLVEEGWNSKQGKWGPDRATVQKRAAKLRSWLFNRKEAVVVVVSHGGFLHALTEDWSGFNASAGELGWVCLEADIANMTRYRMAELRDQRIRIHRKVDAEQCACYREGNAGPDAEGN